ncbi:5-histidylcysteine sulfoxide synthase [Cyanobacterium sp. IPPAS B-1200]|uniref:5-histidylcysteine sulfoxide synthase n=1 Tax=Cyanobacterium sp. IPPAS B-1200 TaxID=1562720 RepID=UPI00085275B9|nr:5-histidylcysteine sulfoxide synthase [Cyanobacterium sp. IPPAS B-1200]OEJ78583.1 sulfatase-modifying factor protein [Cyanobacterium sp. IPPAS B-1200]
MMNTEINNPVLCLNGCTKEDIINYLDWGWCREDILFKSILNRDTYYLNPDPLRNPLIFYLGHSAVFFINKLIMVGLLQKRINPDYERLFEMGVDPEFPDELQKTLNNIRQQSLEDVWMYRNEVYQTVIKVINNTPLSLPIEMDSPWWAIVMGIEHQRIHIETSSMLIRQLPPHLLQKPDDWNYAPSLGKPPQNEMIAVDGDKVILGKKDDDFLYGWDVDFGSREEVVDSFLVSKYMITNHEFLDFVNEGGYENKEFWDEESWEWLQGENRTYPKFWVRDGEGYQYRAMFDQFDLPLDYPVEVNHYEAIAFCRYLGQKKGKKYGLMSESQWHLASKGNNDIDNYNLNLHYQSPTPVGSIKTAHSDAGIYDLRGNLWEWLGDKFTPLSGFKPHFLYQDYSQPFFDNRHYLLVGGAWITNGTEAAPYYRNWFRPHFYQHAGFRVVEK